MNPPSTVISRRVFGWKTITLLGVLMLLGIRNLWRFQGVQEQRVILPGYAPPCESYLRTTSSGQSDRPPLLISAAQYLNGFQSFEQQCIRHCLSAYQASPRLELPSPIPGSQAPDRLLHFIFIADLKQFVEFTLMDYFVIRSAYMRLQPYQILLHTNESPLESPLWNLIRPMISSIHRLEPITEIYGNRVTGQHHISDIARIKVLQQYGGMYMDIDSISLRPFTESMWNPPSGLTMGYQEKKQGFIGCGVIVARKESPFLKRWLESYKTFDDKKWDDHSVRMAGKLASKFPDEIDVLPETYFYRPTWSSLKVLWDELPRDEIGMFQFQHAYAPHYWGTPSRSAGKIQRMSPYTILKENVVIHQILRPLLPHPYFSLVVQCPPVAEELRDALYSIGNQTFELFEVIVLQATSSACVYETIKSEFDNVQQTIKLQDQLEIEGVWELHLEPGSKLHSNQELYKALSDMRDRPSSFLHYTADRKRIRFAFNHSRGITRLDG